MSTNSETKQKVFKVMREAIKLSLNQGGKYTILENKGEDYQKQLINNLYPESKSYQALKEDSLDFHFLLEQSRNCLPDLKQAKYTGQVQKYINTIAYMFEGDFKSIAKKITTEPIEYKVVEETTVEPVVKENLFCKSCNKEHKITNDDIARIRISKSKVIECDCGEILMTFLTATDKRNKVLDKHNEEKEEMDMSSLKQLENLD